MILLYSLQQFVDVRLEFRAFTILLELVQTQDCFEMTTSLRSFKCLPSAEFHGKTAGIILWCLRHQPALVHAHEKRGRPGSKKDIQKLEGKLDSYANILAVTDAL